MNAFRIIAFVVLFVAVVSHPKRTRSPHVILIVADDLGYNDIGWNNDKLQTPFINALAKDGVILDNYYTHPACTPSRVALLTGYYSDRLALQRGVLMNTPYGIPLKFKLLPELMNKAGYNSVSVGKWHLGSCAWEYTPTYRGFQTWLGFYNGELDYYKHCADFFEEDLPDGSCVGFDFRKEKDLAYEYNGQYTTEVFANRMVEIINTYNDDRPLFAYVALQDPHWPLQAPSRYAARCKKSVNKARRNLCASMAAVDDAVKNITKALMENGLYDNSVIIFASDNGGTATFGGNNYPLRGEKSGLYEGGCRVPAFVHSPLLNRKGYINRKLIHVTDWLPTILRLAHFGKNKLDSNIDGFDQWDVISNNAKSPRRSLLYHYDLMEDGTLVAAVRDEQYKFIAGPAGIMNNIVPESETVDYSMNKSYLLDYTNFRIPIISLDDVTPKLYDLIKDPSESHNLASQKPDKVRQMLKLLKMYGKDSHLAMNIRKDENGNPQNFNNTYSPGWCTPYIEVYGVTA